MNTIESLGSRIRQVRRRHGLTQEEFGDKLGISKSSVINYESGKRVPDAVFLIDLLERFNVDAEWLMRGGSGKQEGDNDVAEMIEYMSIPVIKLAVMAEYERLKRVFEPLIREYRDSRKKKNKG
jgi:transcriptional regulator with XRE-family HTH domain